MQISTLVLHRYHGMTLALPNVLVVHVFPYNTVGALEMTEIMDRTYRVSDNFLEVMNDRFVN